MNVFVVEHREGLVLFDTGQDRAATVDPTYFPAGPMGLVFTRVAKGRMGAGETVPARLAALGLRAEDVAKAVVSHLHYDHVGGLRDLPRAEVLVSRAELDSLTSPFPVARGLLPGRLHDGARWRPVDFEPLGDAGLAPFTAGFDLFGDGALVMLPTPGHTPGSMSMLVRRKGGAPLLMVGDLTYDAELLAAGALPGLGDRRRMARAAAEVNELRRRLPGLAVLAAHDPNAAALLERASEG
ncbi:N-acyl homoserine lactonase family protein [Glycomyces paridis]|uniref:N-acyl homoserine lactonase family protein n=1 Tax=Glycomyces paridis TaxID=2126555 RepID=UPI00195AE966|nr:N-acyl homoserine lactonase family protein [Glycomyces paridis]